jgi:hypothetical protein
MHPYHASLQLISDFESQFLHPKLGSNLNQLTGIFGSTG